MCYFSQKSVAFMHESATFHRKVPFSCMKVLRSGKIVVSCKSNCTFLEMRPKAHTPREQRAKWVRLPDPTHAGTKYPVRGNPSLRYRASQSSFLVEFVCRGGHFGCHFDNFGAPGPHLDPKRAQGPQNVRYFMCVSVKRSPCLSHF